MQNQAMPLPRLFLVAPEAPAALIAGCLKAACAAGDVASLLLPVSLAKDITPLAQSLNVAALTIGEPRDALRAGCDGLHVDADGAGLRNLRAALGKTAILGAFAGASRHFAMEAAELGADYVAVTQSAKIGGEPILAWCAEMLEIPCVAFEPVDAAGLDILLLQNPDFIRPADAMWASVDAASRIVGELTSRLHCA